MDLSLLPHAHATTCPDTHATAAAATTAHGRQRGHSQGPVLQGPPSRLIVAATVPTSAKGGGWGCQAEGRWRVQAVEKCEESKEVGGRSFFFLYEPGVDGWVTEGRGSKSNGAVSAKGVKQQQQKIKSVKTKEKERKKTLSKTIKEEKSDTHRHVG